MEAINANASQDLEENITIQIQKSMDAKVTKNINVETVVYLKNDNNNL